jgi:hypothetical protein
VRRTRLLPRDVLLAVWIVVCWLAAFWAVVRHATGR